MLISFIHSPCTSISYANENDINKKVHKSHSYKYPYTWETEKEVLENGHYFLWSSTLRNIHANIF